MKPYFVRLSLNLISDSALQTFRSCAVLLLCGTVINIVLCCIPRPILLC